MLRYLGAQALFGVQGLGSARTAQVQKLASVIDALSPASSTPAGRSWLIKALHPSDPIAECGGVPDETSSPTVMLNYQSTFAVAPPAAAAAPWTFAFQLTPDPVQMGFFLKSLMDGSSVTTTSFFNSQLSGGNTYAERMASFLGQGIYKWRLAYASVSLYQDGPALSDQGTVAAAQYVVDYRKLSCSTASGSYPAQSVGAGVPVVLYAAGVPEFASLQAMPNAYFGQSKFGVYMPLHLDGVCKWHGLHDLAVSGGSALAAADTASYIVSNAASAPTGAWPYPLATPAYIRSASGSLSGTQISLPCNHKWGSIVAVNLSPSTSFSMFVRMGFEVQVVPASPLSSLQRISPKLDRQALDSYALIVRELKDAYPVEFNDLGKLWEVIKGAAKVALPFIRQIPIAGPLIGGAADLFSAFSEKPSAAPSMETARRAQAPPAAALERAQARIATGESRLPSGGEVGPSRRKKGAGKGKGGKK